jgi:hypothetical protein
MKAGEGRYIFCGLRDIVQELEDDLVATEDTTRTDAQLQALVDRRDRTLLKPIQSLSAEFARVHFS